MLRLDEQGTSEEPFFIVLFSSDLWTIFKKYMWQGKKTSNIYNYRNGDIAAYYGYYSLIQLNKELTFTKDCIIFAAITGHLNVIQYLYKRFPEYTEFESGCIPISLFEATNSGHLDVVKFIFSNITTKNRLCGRCNRNIYWKGEDGDRPFCIKEALYACIYQGHLDIIDYFFDNGITNYSYEVIDDLLDIGNLDIIKYVHNRIPIKFNTNMMEGAVYNGYLDIVEFLFDNGIKTCSTEALEQSIEDGHLDMIKFLHKNNMVQFCEANFKDAIINNHIGIVRYIHENQLARCREDVLDMACSQGYIEIIQYLMDEIFCDLPTKRILLKIFTYSTTDAIKFFYETNREDVISFVNTHEEYRAILEESLDN